jgi:hypothetical protein
MKPTPVACPLRVAASPLKGATPVARQSRFHGVPGWGAWLLAVALATPLADGATLEGQSFEERVSVADTELKLNGLGLRAVLIIKAYVAALYLPERAGTLEAVLANPGPKRVEIRMLGSASARDFNRALQSGIRKNTSPEGLALLQPRASRLEAAIDAIGMVHKGDRITLDFDPRRGMLLGLNGQARGEAIDGFDFYAAILRIFIGQRPVDEQVKRGLLG